MHLKISSQYIGHFVQVLTHWGRVTHICASNLTIIGSDNGLSPGRRQAIIWTNVGILLIAPLGTNFSEILIWIQTFSFKKMHEKMSSAKWRPFILGLNELKVSNKNRMVTLGDHTHIWCRWEEIRMITALLKVHHDIQQRHLIVATSVQCLIVTRQDEFVVLPVKWNRISEIFFF